MSICFDIKNNTAKILAHFTNILTHHTLIENSKNNKIHQFLLLFDIFLDSFETWNKNTNRNYCYKLLWAYTKKSYTTIVKQVADDGDKKISYDFFFQEVSNNLKYGDRQWKLQTAVLKYKIEVSRLYSINKI